MNKNYIQNLVRKALAEDGATRDVTTDLLVDSKRNTQANLIAKASGIVCGLKFAEAAFKALDPNIKFETFSKDGDSIKTGAVLASIKGKTRALLSGERVALNFLTWASGLATQTQAFVQAVKPYKVGILDTRKTTPLFREFERYAVRCGGGVNHRFNLEDMVLVKDNHLTTLSKKSLRQVANDLKMKTRKKVEIEVDTFDQFKDVLDSKVDIILLDNMTPSQIKQCVALKKKVKSKVLLEASGGIHLKNVRLYAATGVDRISIGSLTNSRAALDCSLDFIVE